jgi:hypothetical protein
VLRVQWRESHQRYYDIDAMKPDYSLAPNKVFTLPEAKTRTDPGIMFAVQFVEELKRGYSSSIVMPVNIHDAYRQFYERENVMVAPDEDVSTLLAKITSMQQDDRIKRLRDDIRKEKLILPTYSIVPFKVAA